jgi:hypothetical protein
MKITLKFDNKSISVNTESGFELLVDDEVLLSHDGDNGGYADVGYGNEEQCLDIVEKLKALGGCCGGEGCCGVKKSESPYPKTSGASSLFEGESCLKDIVYLVKEVPNSSFISGIRWWSEEPMFGSNVLEVALKSGRVMYYGDVPQVDVEAWMSFVDAGGSAGRFYNTNIKNKFEMLREEDHTDE